MRWRGYWVRGRTANGKERRGRRSGGGVGRLVEGGEVREVV